MKKFLAILLFYFIQQTLQCQNQCDSCLGITMKEYNAKISTYNKLVLVYFKANWCLVCKKQEPILDAIKNNKKNQLELLIIDTDANPLISEYFEINTLPIHKLYKNGIQIWNHIGLLSEQQIVNALKPYE